MPFSLEITHVAFTFMCTLVIINERMFKLTNQLEAMDMKGKAIRIWDIATLALSALYLTGTLTFLQPCAAHDDGSWMNCHWAGRVLVCIGVLLVLLAILKCIVGAPGMKRGLALATAPVALLAILVPGPVISLCMMDTMRCRAVMRPGALVFGILIAAASLFDFALSARAEGSKR